MTGPALPGEPRTARVEPLRARSYAFLLPLAALVLAAWLLFEAYGERGIAVGVLAREGHGLEPGAPVVYRGIAVGEVRAVELAPELEGVRFDVRLAQSAADLARAGARFWVARPELSLEGVRGLDTLVGARYLAVLPGAPGAAPQREFVALDEAPITERIEPGGIEVVLEAEDRAGLAPGAPLTFRGMQVGTVLSLALASDATCVEIRAWVRPENAELVRADTRFYQAGGLELDLGLVGGLEVELDSLRSLLIGAVGLAVPNAPGARVSDGHRFRLHPEADPEWLAWRPPLALGASGAGELRLPRPLRAELGWSAGLFAREHARRGWVLAVAGGVLGPADLLAPDPAAKAGSSSLELAGMRVVLEAEPEWGAGALALRALPQDLAGVEPWPAELCRTPAGPEDCLLVADPGAPPLGLSAARQSRGERGFAVDPALPVDAQWHGAAAVARSDGRLIGILVVAEGSAAIVPLPALPADPRAAAPAPGAAGGPGGAEQR